MGLYLYAGTNDASDASVVCVYTSLRNGYPSIISYEYLQSFRIVMMHHFKLHFCETQFWMLY